MSSWPHWRVLTAPLLLQPSRVRIWAIVGDGDDHIHTHSELLAV